MLWRDNERVGDVRVASYGHTLDAAVGLAWIEPGNGQAVTKKWIDDGKWEVEVAGQRYPAEISIRPLYDPTNEKVKL